MTIKGREADVVGVDAADEGSTPFGPHGEDDRCVGSGDGVDLASHRVACVRREVVERAGVEQEAIAVGDAGVAEASHVAVNEVGVQTFVRGAGQAGSDAVAEFAT